MRRTAVCVVGSAWGDEAKGKMVDYLCDQDGLDTSVIRYNGGAQAGHTVIRDEKRHVFHHFGSGTLAGASTYLSKFFLNNPYLFFQELESLQKIDSNWPRVMADKDGFVTTPWDMLINQLLESHRSLERHGSCGVGINETMVRNQLFPITVADLQNFSKLKEISTTIQEKWVPYRLKQLSITPKGEWEEDLYSFRTFNAFLSQCSEYVDFVQIGDLSLIKEDKIVFEGAQGLLLDQDHPFFPHVTHSYTGLTNVTQLCEEFGISELDVIYMTRAYATRHGAGPFPREVHGLQYKDDTNVPNAWQGTLRFGNLDIDLLKETIENDLKKAGNLSVRHGISVTCLDQVPENNVNFWYNNVEHTTSTDKLVKTILNATNADYSLSYTSFGPTADDVKNV